MSRSPAEAAVTMSEHADDVHALLGCSFGAVIGMHVAAGYPGRLHALVAHEPVAPWLLPVDQRARHEREPLDIQKIYETSGLWAAFAEIARVLGIDPSNQDTELAVFPGGHNGNTTHPRAYAARLLEVLRG